MATYHSESERLPAATGPTDVDFGAGFYNKWYQSLREIQDRDSGLNCSMAVINKEMTRRGARVDGGRSDWRSNWWVGHFERVPTRFDADRLRCLEGAMTATATEGPALREKRAGLGFGLVFFNTRSKVHRKYRVAGCMIKSSMCWCCNPKGSSGVRIGCRDTRVKIVEGVNGLSGSTGYIQDLRELHDRDI
uniref:Uncharacterized protein n=1 Tax=Oryza sativa subsp. japonica TaxID=39947 RepID=Q69U79_ORYSJ|nr:hypothetical protein [Oryza sativa Japonica Group]